MPSANSWQNTWQRWHPRYWTWRHYALTGGILAIINLFGPMGLLHWVQLAQEEGRLKREEQSLQKQILALKAEMARFRRSSLMREHLLREELGLLRSNEVSVEFPNEGGG